MSQFSRFAVRGAIKETSGASPAHLRSCSMHRFRELHSSVTGTRFCTLLVTTGFDGNMFDFSFQLFHSNIVVFRRLVVYFVRNLPSRLQKSRGQSAKNLTIGLFEERVRAPKSGEQYFPAMCKASRPALM